MNVETIERNYADDCRYFCRYYASSYGATTPVVAVDAAAAGAAAASSDSRSQTRKKRLREESDPDEAATSASSGCPNASSENNSGRSLSRSQLLLRQLGLNNQCTFRTRRARTGKGRVPSPSWKEQLPSIDKVVRCRRSYLTEATKLMTGRWSVVSWGAASGVDANLCFSHCHSCWFIQTKQLVSNKGQSAIW